MGSLREAARDRDWRGVLFGIAIQIIALALLPYTRPTNSVEDILLCLVFGFGNSAHMLAFSTAADVVEPKYMATSAAIVNGTMFILGGIMTADQACGSGSDYKKALHPARWNWRSLRHVRYFLESALPSSSLCLCEKPIQPNRERLSRPKELV